MVTGGRFPISWQTLPHLRQDLLDMHYLMFEGWVGFTAKFMQMLLSHSHA